MPDPTLTLISSDLATALVHNGDVLGEGRASVWRKINVLLTPCMGVSLLHRSAHLAWRHRGYGLARLLAKINLLIHRIDIHPACEIEGGMYVPHPGGVVIRAHAGRNFVVLARASICDDGFSPAEQWPRFSDDVWVAAGARVTGKLFVGKGARVGPGAILDFDVPPDALVSAPN